MLLFTLMKEMLDMLKKARFMIGRILKMDYKSLFETSKKVSEITGKNRLLVFFDIVYCGLKYKAGYKDYLAFRFYELNASQRDTYITRGRNFEYVTSLNEKDARELLSNKALFLEKFDELSHRKWLFVDKNDFEGFKSFYLSVDEFIAKPIHQLSGVGIEFFKTDENDLVEMFEKFTEDDEYVLEEIIKQHPKMSALNPSSVNTIRVVSLRVGDQVEFPFIGIRMGNGSRLDNFNRGGIIARVNIEKGILQTDGVSQDGTVYKRHPATNTEFKGFEIPFYQEAIEMVKWAAVRLPGIGYVGWDIAISEEGPLVIEANDFPSHDLLQFPELLDDDRIGLRPVFDGLIDKMKRGGK